MDAYGRFIDTWMAVVVYDTYNLNTTPPGEPSRSGLSTRQRQVLEMLVQGRSNKEIAHALKIAEGTVKIHVTGLFQKLGVRRRAAVALAGRN